MSLMQSTPFIVDGKGHLLGRLASIVAKQILLGQKAVSYTHLTLPTKA